MKKIISLLLLIALFTVSLPLNSLALTDGDWEYKIQENEIIITKYIGNDTVVTVPSTIRNCTVTKMILDETGKQGNHRDIEKITMPDTIKEIGRCFFQSSHLKEINFSKNLEVIGDAAFGSCEELTSVDLSQCTKLKSIGSAFGCCKNLKTFIFPETCNISIISKACFKSTAIEKINIPASVTEIHASSLNCNLKGTLIIPPTVKKIYGDPFCTYLSGAPYLEEVIISYGTEFMSDLDLSGNVDNDLSSGAFQHCKFLQAVYIPDTVTDICIRQLTYGSPNAIVYCSSTAHFIDRLKEEGISYIIDDSVNTKINVLYNGKRISFHSYGQNPEVVNNRTMVPLRSIFETMGATVEWDNNSQTATATRGNTTVKIKIGESAIFKNNTSIPMDVPAQVINGRTMIPVRAVAESFGATVEWDNTCKAVYINE